MKKTYPEQPGHHSLAQAINLISNNEADPRLTYRHHILDLQGHCRPTIRARDVDLTRHNYKYTEIDLARLTESSLDITRHS